MKSGDLAYRQLIDQLRRVRQDRGMLQTELAYAINRDQPFVSRVERGQLELGLVDFILWTKALRLNPVGEFVQFSEQIQPRRARNRL